MSEKEKAAQWRDKITKKLETHKELQLKELPELIKLVKAWEVAINASADAAARVGEVWTRMADTVGRDSDWGAGFANVAQYHKKMVALEEGWARTLEEKFVMPVSITLANETKQTLAKENDVKKALKKYEGVLKVKGTWARKESKRGESMVSAMNELNETVKEVEEKREKIWNDVQWHCAQSYFILLQALTLTIKEKGDFYEKGVANSTQLKPALEAAQKVQPDKALQVKPEDVAVLYSDVDEPSKEKKSTRKTSTMSKRTGSAFITAAAGSSLDLPSVASPVAPSGGISRSGEHSVRATWAPQSAARLEEALNAMSRGPTGAPDSARGQQALPPSSLGVARPAGGVRVRAKWAFTAEREGELSMSVGDILPIIDQTNQNWWMAELNGKRGVVPANYVEVLPEEPALPDEPPAPTPLPSITLPPMMSPRDNTFDADGLPQFPPTSPHGLPQFPPTSPHGLPQFPPTSPHGLPGMLPAPGSNSGRLAAVPSGITPRKHSAGQQGLPLPTSISPRLPGGPGGRPVSTMGIPQAHLGGGFGGHQLPPAIISPRLPTLPPPEPEPALPSLPPMMTPPASGSHTPVATSASFEPVPAPIAIPPPPAHEPPKKDEEWQQFFTDDGHPYFYNAATGESRWA